MAEKKYASTAAITRLWAKIKAIVPTKTSDLTNDSNFISTETDPIFSASVASGITSTDIDNWNDVANKSYEITMDWEDVYSEWQAGYYYDDDNDYAYTQIPTTETIWETAEAYICVSCTPYSNMIPVARGEKYRYQNPPVHLDSKNKEIPSVIIFDSAKNEIESYTRSYEDVWTEITVPSNGAWMAVVYYNYQQYDLQKCVVKTMDESETIDNIMADYRSYSIATPPKKNDLTKGYICFGTDDLRAWTTKNLHQMFTTNSIPYYMASVPERAKACVTDDPYKTNLDYMRLCVAAGGEIMSHSDPWITETNKNDFDTMHTYFAKTKKELEAYGFDVRGVILAGGNGAIDEDDPIMTAWASHYYEYGDSFGEYFPYNFNRILLDDWEDYSSLTSIIQNAVNNHGFVIFGVHEYNANTQLAMDTILSALAPYTKGTDYEFVTPSQLYDLLMPSGPSSSGGATYTISMTGNVITLAGSDGSTSTATLPVYSGGVAS